MYRIMYVNVVIHSGEMILSNKEINPKILDLLVFGWLRNVGYGMSYPRCIKRQTEFQPAPAY